MTNAVQITSYAAEGEATPWRPEPATPMQMIQTAIANGAGLEMVEKLMGLQERWEANQGRKAFDQAIAAAKTEIKPIARTRSVSHGQGKTAYRHEDLAGIAAEVDPILGQHGLSYRFRTNQTGGQISVTCVLSHRDGYSEETTLSAGADTSGAKNAIQAIGSAITYLQRYTLKAALGLASAHDDDGKAAGAPPDAGTISAEQFIALRDLMEQAGGDQARFLKFFKIETLHDLPLARFGEADAMLRKKLAEKATA